MSPAEVLRAARKLIEKPEMWIQVGNIRAGASCNGLCAGNAIYEASGCPGEAPAFRVPQDLLCRAIGIEPGLSGIWRWNDAPERTHAEVLAAFDKAIELAEAEVTA